MGLRMLVGAFRGYESTAAVVEVIMALRRAIDAVGSMQSGVEPLRRIGRCHLAAEHEAPLVEIGAGVILGIEIAALPAPVGPGPGGAVENLLGAALGLAALVRRELGERLLVGSVAPQPSRHIALHYRLQPGRNPRLAEILLREDVAGDLAPFHRHFHIAELEDDGAVRIANLARRPSERDGCVRILPSPGEPTSDTHTNSPLERLFRRQTQYLAFPTNRTAKSIIVPSNASLS